MKLLVLFLTLFVSQAQAYVHVVLQGNYMGHKINDEVYLPEGSNCSRFDGHLKSSISTVNVSSSSSLSIIPSIYDVSSSVSVSFSVVNRKDPVCGEYIFDELLNSILIINKETPGKLKLSNPDGTFFNVTAELVDQIPDNY